MLPAELLLLLLLLRSPGLERPMPVMEWPRPVLEWPMPDLERPMPDQASPMVRCSVMPPFRGREVRAPCPPRQVFLCRRCMPTRAMLWPS